jgi:hypothetical protein
VLAFAMGPTPPVVQADPIPESGYRQVPKPGTADEL